MRIHPDMSNWSLRKKIVSVIMLGSVVCLLVSLTVLVASSASSRYEDSLRQLSGLAEVLSENGQAALKFSDKTEAARLLESLKEHSEIVAAWLVTADGNMLASWSRQGVAGNVPADYRVDAAYLHSDFWSRHAELYQPVIRDRELIGYVLLQADFTSRWNRELADLGKALGFAILSLMVVFILAARLQGVISSPIKDIAATARAIARDKSYGRRVPKQTDDEIGDLVTAFNEMLGEIQIRDEHLIRHRDRLEEEVAKRTAELLKAKNDAEEASRFKGLFLSNMSHEIRTPMNAIIGLSDLALSGELSPKLRDYLGKIHTSSLALLGITNDILDYSKVEAGRLELNSEIFNLEELLKNVLNLFQVSAEAKGLKLVLELDHRVPKMLVGDSLRLWQVLNNLVGNAVKFTLKGNIHFKVTRVAHESGCVKIDFSVRDNGIGMSPEQIANLFQAFTQADSSITRRFGGTGLGLALSRQLVELMGGDIKVESKAGAGSTFSFALSLPLPQQHTTKDMVAGLKNMRAMVVDDFDISSQILRATLESWGFDVEAAASGIKALELLENANAQGKHFELVLLDWRMPGIDGVEVAQMIHKMASVNKCRMPKIVMISAFKDKQLIEESSDVVLDAVLGKPVTPSVLFDTIIRILGVAVPNPAVADNLRLKELSGAIRGAHVLLVDDNEINRMVARELLENAGLKVSEAYNGNDGIAAVLKERFDAVLMDLKMPEMNGIDVTKIIRQHSAYRDLPIIAMTAAVLEQDRKACLAAGMSDHVAKPILKQQLIETLCRWIRPGERSVVVRPVSWPEDVASVFPQDMPGFDIEQSLLLLSGNRGLLKKLLIQFAGKFAGAGEEMDRLARSGKTIEAATLAHNIKGTSGNLGAVELFEAAKNLESELVAGAGYPFPGMEGFNRAMVITMASIARLDTSVEIIPEADSGDFDRPLVVHLLGQLKELLEGNDFVPDELLESIRAALTGQSMRRLLRQIGKHLDDFDYVHAREVLNELNGIVNPVTRNAS